MAHRQFKRRTSVESIHKDNNSNREIEELIQRIVQQVENTSELQVSHPANEQVDKVVFEIEIDNIHYKLLRSQLKLNYCSLSPREQEIARLVVKGLPNKVIANVLGISIWTVSTHLRRIFAKLDVTRRAAMVARVLEDDLLRNKKPK